MVDVRVYDIKLAGVLRKEAQCRATELGSKFRTCDLKKNAHRKPLQALI